MDRAKIREHVNVIASAVSDGKANDTQQERVDVALRKMTAVPTPTNTTVLEIVESLL